MCSLLLLIIFSLCLNFSFHHRAFVAPVDIQAFTSESKSKLLARCQGKTVKHFAQAVKEISLAFEGLQKEKSSGTEYDTDRSVIGCDAPSAERGEADGGDDFLNGETGTGASHGGDTKKEELGEFDSKLEPCSNSRGETESEDAKHSVSFNADIPSVTSAEKNTKVSTEPQVKEELSVENASDIKEETSGDKKESIDSKPSVKRQASLSNGHKMKKTSSGLKRRSEALVEGQKDIAAVTSIKEEGSGKCIDSTDSGEQLKERIKNKVTSSGNRKELYQDAFRSDSDVDDKTANDVLKGKKNPRVSDNSKDKVLNSKGELRGNKKRAQPGGSIVKLGSEDFLHPNKKTKAADMKDAAAKVSLSKKMTSDVSGSKSHERKALKHSELKASPSNVNNDMVLALKAQATKANVRSDVSNDEAVLPLSKRRRRALEAMSNPSTLDSDDKAGKASHELKIDASCSNVGKSLGSQVRRRRAVLYDDDDDDEEPKTPVHVGSSKNSKGPLPAPDKSNVTGPSQESVNAQQSAVAADNPADARDSSGNENTSAKDYSSQLNNKSMSPSQHENVEKFSASHVAIGGTEKTNLEHLPLKHSKTISVSPKMSPHSVFSNKSNVEHSKGSKPLVNKGSVTHKKVQAVSGKSSGLVSDSVKSSQNQGMNQKVKTASSGEKPKVTPKSVSRMNDRAISTDASLEPWPFEMYN